MPMFKKPDQYAAVELPANSFKRVELPAPVFAGREERPNPKSEKACPSCADGASAPVNRGRVIAVPARRYPVVHPPASARFLAGASPIPADFAARAAQLPFGAAVPTGLPGAPGPTPGRRAGPGLGGMTSLPLPPPPTPDIGDRSSCALGGIYYVGGPSDRHATVGEALRDARARGCPFVEVRIRARAFGLAAPESATITMPTIVRGPGYGSPIGTGFRNPHGYALTLEGVTISSAPGYGIFQRGGELSLRNVRIRGVTALPGYLPREGIGTGIDFGGPGAIGRWNDILVQECAGGGIRLSDHAWAAGGPIRVRRNLGSLAPHPLVTQQAVSNAVGGIDIRDGASLGAGPLLVEGNELHGVSLRWNARLWMIGGHVASTHKGRLAGTLVESGDATDPDPVATINVYVLESEFMANNFVIDGSPPPGQEKTTVGILLNRRHATCFEGRVSNCSICVVFPEVVEIEDAMSGRDTVRFDCDYHLQARALPVPDPSAPWE